MQSLNQETNEHLVTDSSQNLSSIEINAILPQENNKDESGNNKLFCHRTLFVFLYANKIGSQYSENESSDEDVCDTTNELETEVIDSVGRAS